MKLDHTFAEELTALCSEVKPIKLINSRLVAFNHTLAAQLRLPSKWAEQANLFSELFCDSGVLNHAAVAQKYGGHQFGQWNPDLGDGRGLLLAEVVDQNQQRWDLHLKGSGPTPYSRFADGQAVLRSSIREYLASEAMHHLGIPTSRGLCLIDSDQPVYRETRESGAQMIRVCQSHIRFGHFEYLYHSQQFDKLQSLFDYCFSYHFTAASTTKSPYLAMLEMIVQNTAKLIAKWQAFGFTHGVMNTDNMSIHGITFDYGPFAFLDDFDPTFISNQSDPQGRYAFDKQPEIGLWNLNALAQSFTPYLEFDQIKQALSSYQSTFKKEYMALMHNKLGLRFESTNNATGCLIINTWLDILAAEKRDYTASFRQLCEFDLATKNASIRTQFINQERFDNWAKIYSLALKKQRIEQSQRQTQMRLHNPRIVLRNYLAEQVINKAQGGDFEMFQQLIAALKKPYQDIKEYQQFSLPPPNLGKKIEISCSS